MNLPTKKYHSCGLGSRQKGKLDGKSGLARLEEELSQQRRVEKWKMSLRRCDVVGCEFTMRIRTT